MRLPRNRASPSSERQACLLTVSVETEEVLPASSCLLILGLHVTWAINYSCLLGMWQQSPRLCIYLACRRTWKGEGPEHLYWGCGTSGRKAKKKLSAPTPLWLLSLHCVMSSSLCWWAPLAGAGAPHICSLPPLIPILSHSQGMEEY